METPKAFISFDYEKNSNEQTQFLDLLKKSGIELIIDSCSSEPTLPPNQWQNVVSDKINYVNMLIVLVSKTTATLKGVSQEIEAAHYQNIPIFGVYVGGANNTTILPPGISKERIVNLEKDAIANQIQKVMKEGKNELLWGNEQVTGSQAGFTGG